MQVSVDTRTLIIAFLVVSVIALAISLVLVAWLAFKIRSIRLKPDADALDALRAAPLPVVIVLDLLDLALDIFAAPISWVLLKWLGLSPLRGATVIKDIIPFTGFIPAMTIAWVGVRAFDRYQIYSAKRIASRQGKRQLPG